MIRSRPAPQAAARGSAPLLWSPAACSSFPLAGPRSALTGAPACLLPSPWPAPSPALPPNAWVTYDPVRHEPRIDIPKSRGWHRKPASWQHCHDEYIGDDTPAGGALAQGGESPLQFGPAEENTVRVAHAA